MTLSLSFNQTTRKVALMAAEENRTHAAESADDDDLLDLRMGTSLMGTDWAMIHRAAESGEHQSKAIELLARRYWPAIYVYLRAAGKSVEDAADLTQGFICDVVLNGRLLEIANPERGRFRTLLLRAVRNYMYQQYREDHRRRRSPAHGETIAIDHSLLENIGVAGELTPEQAFVTQWSTTIVREVLLRVRETCLEEGLDAHWYLFEHRVARPMINNETPKPYEALLDRFGLRDVSQASNMMITVKRRFAQALREEIAGTMAEPEPDEVEQEIRDILNDLERPS